MNRHFTIAMLLVLAGATNLFAQPVRRTTQDSAASQIARATQKFNQAQNYQLAYKFKKGEKFSIENEQVVNTKCHFGGITEDSSSRSAAVWTWKIINVDQLGNMTFSLTVESMDMWQKVGEAEPVSYNSKTDKAVPKEYKDSAEFLGGTLAVFTVSPSGKVLDRKSKRKDYGLGLGSVVVPLPDKPVPVGYKWHIPKVLEATDENGVNRKLKARVLYTLDKVKDGNAYVKLRTEVLTPIKSQKIKSTIMQKLTNGHIVFNIPTGRVIRKRIEWDERAQGFEGPDSFLEYVGRMTETLVPGTKSVANRSTLSPLKPVESAKKVQIKTRDGKPIMRK